MMTAKQRFQNYIDLIEEIENQNERLLRLAESMSTPRASRLDGMPRAGRSADRIGSAITKKEALEANLKDAVAAAEQEYHELERAVCKLRRARERMVIRLRYFDRCTWPEVTEAMYGAREDFDDRLESYTRRAQRIHGDALVALDRIISPQSTNNEQSKASP